MKKLFTTDKIPTDCRECPYFHANSEQTCGLCNDHMPHFRVQGEEPWDDDQVMDCPLHPLREVFEDLINCILDKEQVVKPK